MGCRELQSKPQGSRAEPASPGSPHYPNQGHQGSSSSGHLPGHGDRPRLGCHVSSPTEVGDQSPAMLLVRAWNGVLGCRQDEGRSTWGYWGPGSQDWNTMNCLKTASEVPYHSPSVGSSSGWGWIWTPWASSCFSLASVSLVWVSYTYLNLLCTSFVLLHCQSKRNMTSKCFPIVNKMCSWHPSSSRRLCSTKQYHAEVFKIR